jgi:hypothetical protein
MLSEPVSGCKSALKILESVSGFFCAASGFPWSALMAVSDGWLVDTLDVPILRNVISSLLKTIEI